jgi:ferredoxin
MAEGVLNKKDLGRLISAVEQGAQFFAPVRSKSGVSLSAVDSAADVYFGAANVRLPIKRFFFPQSETLYTYAGDEVQEVPLESGKAVLFGVRPCDAHALTCLDKVFVDEQYIDPYYQSRREATTVVVLTCKAPPSTCFCTSVGGSPAGKRGADVLVADLGQELLFESVSDKGAEFMKTHAALFAESSAEQKSARDEAAAAAEKGMARLDLDTAGVAAKLKQVYDSPVWDDLAQRCLGCGACTFFCPTCHCFGLHDETSDGRGSCLRVHDACMFPGFTSEASGHNPRAKKGQRMRQRIMHKFRYAVENFNEFFCTGCGRCITCCPVNVDVRESLTTAAQSQPQKAGVDEPGTGG